MHSHNSESRCLPEIIIQGPRIYLRNVCLQDVTDAYQRWMNDAEVNRFLETRFSPQSKQDIASYVQTMTADPDSVFLAIIVQATHKHIGNLKIGPINRFHQFAELSLVIGEKAYWRSGYGTEAISLACDYAFKVLKLHKLVAGFYADNIGSIKAFEKNGFSREGLRPRHRFYRGAYVDEVLMGRLG